MRFARIQDQCIRDVVRMQEDDRAEGRDRRRIPPRLLLGPLRRAHRGLRHQAGAVQIPRRSRTRDRVHRALCGRASSGAASRWRSTNSCSCATSRRRRRRSRCRRLRPCISTAARDFADRRVYPTSKRSSPISAAIFREEIADLAAAGCRYIQLDEVAIALLCDPAIREQRRGAGQRSRRAGRSLYRSHQRGASPARRPTWWSASTCAAAISRGTISPPAATNRWPSGSSARTSVNHFLLEYDTPRAGDFAPLRFVPKDKGVVLGLVSSKTPALESLDDLKRRIDEAAQIYRPRPAGDQPAMRFRLDGRRQSADARPTSAPSCALVVEAAHAIWG